MRLPENTEWFSGSLIVGLTVRYEQLAVEAVFEAAVGGGVGMAADLRLADGVAAGFVEEIVVGVLAAVGDVEAVGGLGGGGGLDDGQGLELLCGEVEEGKGFFGVVAIGVFGEQEVGVAVAAEADGVQAFDVAGQGLHTGVAAGAAGLEQAAWAVRRGEAAHAAVGAAVDHQAGGAGLAETAGPRFGSFQVAFQLLGKGQGGWAAVMLQGGEGGIGFGGMAGMQRGGEEGLQGDEGVAEHGGGFQVAFGAT